MGRGRTAAAAFRFLDVYFVVKILFIFIFGHRKSRLVTSGHLFPGFATQPEPQNSTLSEFTGRLLQNSRRPWWPSARSGPSGADPSRLCVFALKSELISVHLWLKSKSGKETVKFR
jgi:hypothetical protein